MPAHRRSAGMLRSLGWTILLLAGAISKTLAALTIALVLVALYGMRRSRQRGVAAANA